MREERYVVQRPVTETAYQPQVQTVMRPVTQCQTRYVDQGCYVDQWRVRPRCERARSCLAPATQVVDPLTGIVQAQRGGLAWTSGYTPSQQVVQRVWRPNVVAQQFNTVSYCPEQVTVQVPVQVCKMVAEEQVRQVPVQGAHGAGRVRAESAGANLPASGRTCAAAGSGPGLQDGDARTGPPGAGTTCRMVEEEKVEPYQVRVCKWVCEKQTIQVPHVVQKQVPVPTPSRFPTP